MNAEIDFKDPRFLRWAGAILVIVVVVPLWFTQTFLPITYASRSAEIDQLETRHQQLSRDLEKARLLVRNLERVEREYETLHAQWQVASTLLPEANEMPDLLRKVSAAGKQSGVDFKLFRPEPPVSREFYMDNPVSVRIEGGYHQTGVFLSRLANLNRIVNVSDLRLEGIRDQKEGGPFTVETELTLTAYTLTGRRAPDGAGAGTEQLASNDAGAEQPASPTTARSSH